MSDNQQTPAEQPAAPAYEQPAQPVLPEETDEILPVSADAEENAAEAEDGGALPEDDRVFGLPRPCFHGAAFGVAAGYILCGVIGAIFKKMPDATICAVVCAVIGYLIAKRRYDRQKSSAEDSQK